MQPKISLQDIAIRLGVSVKTVSGALHNRSIRMSEETRRKIRSLADELGYEPNLIARGMRSGVMPIIGMIGDGLITQPFASEIVRSFDNVLRTHDLSILVTDIAGGRGIEQGLAELQRLLPRGIVYASMYHHVVALPAGARGMIELMINCREADNAVPALVPAERQAGFNVTRYLIERGRRDIAFLTLPGLVASSLREHGLRAAFETHDLIVNEDWIRPATRGATYSDRARSVVREQIAEWMAAPQRPDAILCGNDRVALEVYGALRRVGVDIPGDVAVASFDNQVEIAARLDPPLTTMALPHREMGRIAGEILAGQRNKPDTVEEIPFRLIERASV
ncbi:LacI family transcriptional regulator [Labrys miyagiensis]|uniref:LacI family transcriptional regulator n=1 Tax=Labrys miyagiensis TaxID=346912 RepID=A0ABQ6CXG5_9HYPH|nr:LacI family DNA-binding transcriptional regulator [Labrys miyagiensis]GLS23369.1 LacI family transcriptional regulator [Labrys miyagiensis]